MIVSLIALFLSLGGASYAVVATLPEHSVGKRQLQAGAVTVGALGFPLGGASATASTSQPIGKGLCDAPPPPGTRVHPICPRRFFPSQNRPSLHVYARHPGHVEVLGTIGLNNEGPPGTHATVAYGVAVDRAGAQECLEGAVCGREFNRDLRSVTLSGGEQQQAPILLLVRVLAGSLTIEPHVSARYSSYEGGDVIVGPVTLEAVLLP
jgi:hypothetical protein